MIYMDNAATTPVCMEARYAMQYAIDKAWGNPSSLHAAGRAARELIEQARIDIAECLGINADQAEQQIIFTSGATESCNHAIQQLMKYGWPVEFHADIEHSAVSKKLNRLNRAPWQVQMLANNETGQIYLEQVYDLLVCKTPKRQSVLIDATAAMGQIKVTLNSLLTCAEQKPKTAWENPFFLAFSGHKFGAPKGTGCLVRSWNIVLDPMILGGEQEHGYRAGTENVLGIVGMAAALKHYTLHMKEFQKKEIALRDMLIEGVLDKVDCAVLNGAWVKGSCAERLPGNVNFSFMDGDIDGTQLVTMLDLKYGICASSGAACHGHATEPSSVILSTTGSEKRAKSSLRLTLSAENTEQEVETAIYAIKDCIDTLCQTNGNAPLA